MMETQFRGWSRAGFIGLALNVFLGTAGCSGLDESEPGTVRGEFVENIARYDDGRSDVTYSLFVGDDRQKERQLVFDKAPDILSNTEIKVWGEERAGRIVVKRYEVISDLAKPGARGVTRQALVDAAPIPP